MIPLHPVISVSDSISCMNYVQGACMCQGINKIAVQREEGLIERYLLDYFSSMPGYVLLRRGRDKDRKKMREKREVYNQSKVLTPF